MGKYVIKFDLNISRFLDLHKRVEKSFINDQFVVFWWDKNFNRFSYGYQLPIPESSVPDFIESQIIALSNLKKDSSVWIYVNDPRAYWSTNQIIAKLNNILFDFDGEFDANKVEFAEIQ
jgi:hypothetical protein